MTGSLQRLAEGGDQACFVVVKAIIWAGDGFLKREGDIADAMLYLL